MGPGITTGTLSQNGHGFKNCSSVLVLHLTDIRLWNTFVSNTEPVSVYLTGTPWSALNHVHVTRPLRAGIPKESIAVEHLGELGICYKILTT